MALSFVAQSARGAGQPPVPQTEVDKGTTIPERFLIRWRGEADPDHAKAIDAYWISAAEHGMNASTFTARVVASTGADVAAALSRAVGALSGPLHGGAPSRVLKMLDGVGGDRRRREVGQGRAWTAATGSWASATASTAPRTRAPACLRRTAREIGSRRFEVAEALEQAALAELKARKPDRVLATNVEYWSAGRARHGQRARPTCSPRCSPARASPAGRRTSSSRSARRGSSARPRSTSGRGRAPSPRSRRRRTARARMSRSARASSSPRAAISAGGRMRPLAQALAQLGARRGVTSSILDRGCPAGWAGASTEAAVLEAVDDAGDVRVVAVQRAGEVAHRARLTGLETFWRRGSARGPRSNSPATVSMRVRCPIMSCWRSAQASAAGSAWSSPCSKVMVVSGSHG
jgi:hypothetical protein